jgi:hypothetical protein
VVLADDDETVLPSDVLRLPPSPDVHIVRVPGKHSIAYDQPDVIAELLLAQLTGTADPQGARHDRR